MRQLCPSFIPSIRWMGVLSMLCLTVSCSSPRLAQTTLPSDQTTPVALLDEAPQAAQTRPAMTDLPANVEEVELVASTDPSLLPAIAKQVDASLTNLSAENPRLARKVAKIARKAEEQAAASVSNPDQAAIAKDQNAAQKLLAKATKKFDIMKAKKADAAQANTTLVGLGALLAVVGLVLLLATSGSGPTIGLISLIVGVVLLVISLLS